MLAFLPKPKQVTIGCTRTSNVCYLVSSRYALLVVRTKVSVALLGTTTSS